jgi:L-fuculose-phosphate aldolase
MNLLRFGSETSEKDLRAAIVETGRIAYEKELMVSNDGNISVRLKDGHVLITPTGVCKGRMEPDDLLIVDVQGNVIKCSADPTLKVSSEQPMHLEVYRQRPDVRAVIHAHPPFSTALTIAQKEFHTDVLPEVVVLLGEIPVTEFALPSSPENALAIRRLIVNHDALMIRQHGSLTVGRHLEDALNHLERLEHVAKTMAVAELLGHITTLPEDLMGRLTEMHVERVVKEILKQYYN